MTAASMRDVAIVAPTTVGYLKKSAHAVPWFVAGTLREMLSTAHLSKDAVDGLIVVSYRSAPDNCAHLAHHLGLSPRFVMDLPYGGAAGIMAVRRAARAVQSGDAEVIACIGADVPPAPGETGANFSTFWRDGVQPYGAGGFNGIFSLITDSYARDHGVRSEDFGALCAAQRTNAIRAHRALLPKPLSIEDYLTARRITSSLGLYDCVMRCSGAEGVLVMPVERARALGLAHAVIAGSVERHNASPGEDVQRFIGWQPDDRDALFAMANTRQADIDFVQAYDDYPVIVMLQLESLGFCDPGQAARFLRSRSLGVDGTFPLNTCGGMLSAGQAGAAGGFMGLTEAVRQLTGLASTHQVPNARRGLVSCYGCVSFERGVSWSSAILEAGQPV